MCARTFCVLLLFAFTDADVTVYIEELEEILTLDHVTDHVTQAPAVNQLVSCLQLFPLEDPLLTYSANASW